MTRRPHPAGDGAAHAGSPRILIVRVGAMGDVLHALPAVAWLRSQLPHAWLGWAVEPRWASLLRVEGAAARSDRMPLIDCLHPVPARQWSRHPVSLQTLRSILSLRRHLHAQRYTIAVDLQGSLRSSVICRLSGAAVIVGSAAPRETPARWAYTRRVPFTAVHVIEQAAELVGAALDGVSALQLPSGSLPCAPAVGGQQLSSLLPSGALPRDSAAESWALAFLSDTTATTALLETAPVVVLAPTAGWGAKEWGAVKFGHLAAALVRQGCRVCVNSNPSAPDSTALTVQRTAHLELSPELQAAVRLLPATIPQLTAILRHASLLVAGDTGPLHLAAALHVPCVGVFGPTDPERTGPYFQPSATIRNAASVTSHRRHAVTEFGLRQVTLDEVLGAATTLLRQHMVRK